MENNLKVLAICGSLRNESFNRKVLQLAKKIASEFASSVDEAVLKELNLPLYDGDIELAGFPESVLKLKSCVEQSNIILIASPEYNHSISGALKNALDWLSRGKNSLNGKTAAIFGASTGLFGTIRGQAHLRQILSALNVAFLPQPQVFIRSAKDAFDDDGSLKDKLIEKQLKELIKNSINICKNN
jgi:chromate reductase, NAD(P)H dehydrogenase (quinone)